MCVNVLYALIIIINFLIRLIQGHIFLVFLLYLCLSKLHIYIDSDVIIR